MSLKLLPGRVAAIATSGTYNAARLRSTTLRTSWRREAAPRRAFGSHAALLEKKYTKDHEWIEASPDGKSATLGISTYAAEQLGDVIYVELPALGTEVGHGDAIGAVESVKSASDIMTPVSGKILEANNKLEETPGLLNKSPEEDGWIAKLEIADQAEMDELMSGEQYKQFTEEEGA